MQDGSIREVAAFDARLEAEALAPLARGDVETLQVNVTRRCDLACHHCHVEAGPNRTESLDGRTADRILALLERSPGVRTLDLTGGAPELNESFRHLVAGARALGRAVIDRCNLTVLLLPDQRGTAEFLAEHGVRIVASVPCYTRENLEKQRGRGVFARSIEALQRLNALGYARAGSSLELDLVYNPLEPVLPPDQRELEERYEKELRSAFGIEFSRLLTITNMPIKRFARTLARTGRHAEYLSLLANHFDAENVPMLMCRSLVSVGYDGRLYDCDFNQMLDIPISNDGVTVWDVPDLGAFRGRRVATGLHCYGCTAGSGSSCGGSLRP